MTKVMIKKKFRSYNQQELKLLSDSLCDDIENVLDIIGISDYRLFDKMVVMRCPIHGGDNNSAFNLYFKGDSYRGNWKCRTHQCEDTFKASIIGFIRGFLSHQKGWEKPGDDMVSFDDAVKFVRSIIKKDLSLPKVDKKQQEKNKFINIVNNINSNETTIENKIGRQHIVKSLDIPSKYFIDRGFTSDILIKYDVGECRHPDKEMFGRAVVPIYDMNYKYMVGCSGRSTFTKCENCKSYHSKESSCPKEEYLWQYSKWKHNKGFKTQEHLYNYWFAKEHIEKSKSVILVESPGNVWRLEESGIHNSVAIFGSVLQEKQKLLLDISGAMTIYLLMDNDEAGKQAEQKIYDKCYKTYNISKIDIDHTDVAEMTIEEVKQIIAPQIQERY